MANDTINVSVSNGGTLDASITNATNVVSSSTSSGAMNGEVTHGGSTTATVVGSSGVDVSVTAGGKGEKGDTGATGPAGPQGDTGLAGADGAAGPKGDTGLTGATGPKGDKGDTGSTGAAGPANSLSIGTVTQGTADATITGTAPTQTLNLVIPKGDTGATGAAGTDGTNGTDGSDGAAATIAVGTVTTGAAGSSATITNSGTSAAAVFDFSIPRGDTGASGSGSGDMQASTYDPNTVAADAFAMDNMAQGTTNKFVTATDVTHLSNLSGTNTGDQTSVTGNAGTVTNGVYTTDTGTVTNTMLAGSIASTKLANTAVANLSGTNTGDQITVSGNAGTATTLQTSRTIGTLTGDVTSAGSTFNGSANNTNATVVGKINGVSMAGLATGILKNTTTTGVPSIAVAGDFPTLNQNTTGSAATLTTSRTIGTLTGDVTSAGSSFNGSAANTNATVVGKINGVSMAGLATGILKNTTSTGVPSIATAGTDYTTPSSTETVTNKSISGSSNTLTNIGPAARTGGFKIVTIAKASLGSTGNLAVTGVGFRPKYVQFEVIVSANSTITNNGHGATDGTSQFYIVAFANSTSPARFGGTDACIAYAANSTTLSLKASYVSFDSDGFTINVGTAASSFDVMAMCFA